MALFRDRLPHPWLKVWLLASLFWGGAILTNETLLRFAKHEPSVVSDADLFCSSYLQVGELNQTDVVFLGASRMQTGIDLAVAQQQIPAQKVLMLAQSGKGTSYPVFQGIIEDTSFNGTIVIDETEHTLVAQEYAQQSFVDHCEHASFDRRLNRQIATVLQSHFTFPNPQSSSFRLWGNLLIDREFPEPFYTKTLPDRQQLVDYERAMPSALYSLAQERLKGADAASAEKPPDMTSWLANTRHWQPLIQAFQQRGGTVIFVRMPISQERWHFEEQLYPPSRYWHAFISHNKVQSVHFDNYPELSSFELADTSHLSFQDKADFTASLSDILSAANSAPSSELATEVKVTP